MKTIVVRNLMIVLGIYWFSMWVVLPIALICAKITDGIIYSGTVGAFVMHVVSAIPVAIVSLGGGILCIYILAESSHKYWLLLLAVLYAITRFTAFHYARAPELTDRIFQLVESIIPAITCYVGGTVAIKTRKTKPK